MKILKYEKLNFYRLKFFFQFLFYKKGFILPSILKKKNFWWRLIISPSLFAHRSTVSFSFLSLSRLSQITHLMSTFSAFFLCSLLFREKWRMRFCLVRSSSHFCAMTHLPLNALTFQLATDFSPVPVTRFVTHMTHCIISASILISCSQIVVCCAFLIVNLSHPQTHFIQLERQFI